MSGTFRLFPYVDSLIKFRWELFSWAKWAEVRGKLRKMYNKLKIELKLC